MRDSKRQKKKFARSKCSWILHALHKLRKKRTRKTSVVQADWLRSHFTLSQAQSFLSQTTLYIYILVVFGLSTLNSNLTNHKLQCKKIANKKCQHMSLQPWGIQTRYWALKYADALYRSRFRAFATQASLAKQNKRSSYQVKLKLW